MNKIIGFVRRKIEKITNPWDIATTRNRKWFYTLAKITSLIADKEGDIAECGVFRGSTLLGIAHLLKKKNISRKIYGLDSFEGFPEKELKDIDKGITEETFANVSYEEVSEKIRKLGFSNITLIKGFFKDTLKQLEGKRFILVHLDCDLYDSYKECLNFLYDKVLPGGYIVFDEYVLGAKKAIDEFLSDKKEKLQYFKEIKNKSDIRYFIKKE